MKHITPILITLSILSALSLSSGPWPSGLLRLTHDIPSDFNPSVTGIRH